VPRSDRGGRCIDERLCGEFLLRFERHVYSPSGLGAAASTFRRRPLLAVVPVLAVPVLVVPVLARAIRVPAISWRRPLSRGGPDANAPVGAGDAARRYHGLANAMLSSFKRASRKVNCRVSGFDV
jgi:hypothetical protein